MAVLLLLLLLSVVLNCVDVVLVLVLKGVGGPKWCCVAVWLLVVLNCVDIVFWWCWCWF